MGGELGLSFHHVDMTRDPCVLHLSHLLTICLFLPDLHHPRLGRERSDRDGSMRYISSVEWPHDVSITNRWQWILKGSTVMIDLKVPGFGFIFVSTKALTWSLEVQM